MKELFSICKNDCKNKEKIHTISVIFESNFFYFPVEKSHFMSINVFEKPFNVALLVVNFHILFTRKAKSYYL